MAQDAHNTSFRNTMSFGDTVMQHVVYAPLEPAKFYTCTPGHLASPAPTTNNVEKCSRSASIVEPKSAKKLKVKTNKENYIPTAKAKKEQAAARAAVEQDGS